MADAMNRKSVSLTAARVLFMLTLPVLLFTFNMDMVAHSDTVYLYGLDRYGAAGRLGVDSEEVARAGRELIDYWTLPQEQVDIIIARRGETIQLFNQKEVDHLIDVKNLISFNRRMMFVLLGYAVAFGVVVVILRRRRFAAYMLNTLKWGGLLTVGLLVLLAGVAVVNFQSLFLLFHLVSFSNMGWVLNPATDRLIQMFPQPFFRDATMLVVGATALEGVLLVWTGWWGRRRLSATDADAD
ncbi:MAG: TIGR01906 family membrane protein [Dehalococcoidia bacterium]|jgi:integral membrane protein (TIGR01906 family)|nr:TIGR01906 family membrane protein [Dehalococcoidia bacterium]